MALPDPEPGLVVRYDYLWADEAKIGRDGGKDRPTCLVFASDAARDPRFVVILPITHAKPAHGTIGIEIPAAVKKHLGLDAAPSWIVVSEHNVDEWPNAGLAPIPGRAGQFAYGHIPPKLFAQVQARFLELTDGGRTRRVRR